MKKRLILCIILLIFMGCKQSVETHDADFNKAHELFTAGQYEAAHELMLKAAEAGDAEAQSDIAWMYLNGIGVDQHIEFAKFWYDEAVAQNSDKAMLRLAALHIKKVFKENSCTDIIALLNRAKSNGNYEAIKMTASLYETGLCVEMDKAKANELYHDVVNSSKVSNCTLGQMYFLGKGVNKDYKKAVSLLLSDLKGNEYLAGNLLGLAYDEGYGVERDVEKSFMYYKMSADHGNSASQYNTGINLYNGLGVKMNKESGVEFIERAASKNHKLALYFLGYSYELGKFFEKDIERAKEYYEKAVSLGLEPARKRLEALQ